MQPPDLLLRAVAILGLAVAAPGPAPAQDRPCAARVQVVERLAQRYGETLQSIGLQSAEGVVEVYASAETGTWTILLTRPDGAACLLASGEAWESVAPARAGKPA